MILTISPGNSGFAADFLQVRQPARLIDMEFELNYAHCID